MKSILFILLVLSIIYTGGAYSQNAPVSTINSATSYGTTQTVAITATDFNNIGSCNIQILYDPAVAICTSVNLGQGTSGGIAANISIPGVITIGWYTWPGITRPDNSTVFDLNFTRMDYGYSAITWSTDYGDRQWSNGSSEVLNDQPLSEYYIDGSLQFLSESAISLDIMAFLEGPYVNGEMSTTLNENGLIPLSQPYSSAPWLYLGSESVAEIQADAVDWVLIELRESEGDASTATPDRMIAQRAGFLMMDGSVKDMDGLTNLSFPVLPLNNLFINIYHRNHIAAISANPTPITNGSGNYDFSSGESQVLGDGSGHKELSSGIWGLAAGDSNADGIINTLDKQDQWDQTTGQHGYFSFDFSFDSQINNIDKNEFWNLNFNFTSQVP